MTGVGEAVVSTFVQSLLKQLGTKLVNEYKKVCGVADEVDKLQSTVARIGALLRDAEAKGVADESSTLWLRDLEEAAYEADDAVDEFCYGALQMAVEGNENLQRYGRNRRRDKVKSFFSSMSPTTVQFRRKLAYRIEEVCKKMDEIAKKNNNLNPSSLSEGSKHSSGTRVVRETGCLVTERYVIGRISELESIINTLLSSEDGRLSSSSSSLSRDGGPESPSLSSSFSLSSALSYEAGDDNLSVLPIVGIPGIGKTTLAQVVFNDDRVKEYFDLKVWVYVSNDFDVKRITKQIFESVNTSKEKQWDLGNLNVLQKELSDKLNGRRFLLVLDDVWNCESGEWLKLTAPLAHGRNGSQILVTTRQSVVADTVGTLDPIHLHGLSLDDCWLLLQKCTSARGDLQKSQIVEETCRKIVENLNGAPLVVKTLGKILSSKGEGRLREILENEIWELPQGDGILPVLRLSYEHLSPHLKRCFAYCSLFPRGYEFDRSKLVKLWIAQGYIQAQDAKQMEDVGGDCFDELLSNSFFQKVDDHYIMYDLYHYLARSLPNHGCAMIQRDDGKQVLEKGIHHLSFSVPKLVEFETQLNRLNNLRSLLYIRQYKGVYESEFVEFPSDLFASLKCLRVLDLSGSNITVLFDSVGDLIHLRLLDLSHTKIRELPGTISKLYNLCTLDLKNCHDLKELPCGVLNLISLRHLGARKELVLKLSGIGRLTSLQELEIFNVSQEEGYKMQELKSMNELRGKLSILNIQNVRSQQEADAAELKSKKHLDEIVLGWEAESGSDSNKRDWDCEGQVLEGLHPPSNLRVLSVYRNGGSKPPTWMDNFSIGNLTSITLRDCRWDFLPPLGMLPYLATLKIEYFLYVEKVGSDFHGNGVSFPSLEILELRHMHGWKKWSFPVKQQAFPSLRKLLIEDCPKLENTSLPLPLESLKIEKCPILLTNSNFVLLESLLSLSSLSCSFENSFPDLQSCVEQTMQYLTSLEGLEICFCDESTTDLRWSQRPQWMPFNFAQGRAADEVLSRTTSSIHDSSDIRIFLLYAQNFPDYPQVFRRDVCLRIRKHEDGNGGCHSLSTCMLEQLNSLKRLSMKGCLRITSLLNPEVFIRLTALESLELDGCQELKALALFPEQHSFISLKILKIVNCPDLSILPRLRLISLEELQVENCEELVSMDLHEMVSLKKMEIGGCPNLNCELFTGRLTSLRELRLRQCGKLISSTIADELVLQQLTSLQILEISSCNDLRQLPTNLCILSSLNCLSILDCPAIMSLPQTGLPEPLKELRIDGCPALQEACQTGGSDWPKVAYIPKKKINCSKCHPFRCRCNIC